VASPAVRICLPFMRRTFLSSSQEEISSVSVEAPESEYRESPAHKSISDSHLIPQPSTTRTSSPVKSIPI